MNKPWYRSKTLWICILSAAVGALEVLAGSPTAGWVLLASGAVHGALRGITTGGISRGR